MPTKLTWYIAVGLTAIVSVALARMVPGVKGFLGVAK